MKKITGYNKFTIWWLNQTVTAMKQLRYNNDNHNLPVADWQVVVMIMFVCNKNRQLRSI